MFFFLRGAFDPKADKYVLFKKWGTEGSGNGEFQRIHDLDFDLTETYLYVVDRDGNRIQVFDKNGTFITKWGSEGTGVGKFRVPYSADVDSNGDVWVADRNNNRIQKFNNEGKFLFKFGSPGNGNGEFNLPRQIAVDKNVQFLYVVDSENHRIQVFDNSGKYIKQWGGKGKSDAKFDLPVSIIMDNNGDLIVNDRGMVVYRSLIMTVILSLSSAVLERTRSSLESLNIWLWISTTISMLTMQDLKRV